MRKISDKIIYSPSDLIRFVSSPFASWMDRYYLENPTAITPDKDTEDQILIAETGNQHELSILNEFKEAGINIVEIPKDNLSNALLETRTAIKDRNKIIYQAALESEGFAGFADFLILEDGSYQIWDTKLARSPKPYYAIQLCCYAEMFSETTGEKIPDKFGIILGSKDRVEFRIEDFIHYYRRVKEGFVSMQNNFSGNFVDRPEPLPYGNNPNRHGRWTSHANSYFVQTDHLVRVAGITVGQIKKLKEAGIVTMTELSKASGKLIPKLAADSLEKLVAQAHLQCETLANRLIDSEARPLYEILPQSGVNGEPIGLAALPQGHPADVFFDMEGYPLIPGGLEYLFGVCSYGKTEEVIDFNDWWAHNRDEEKIAFEGFIDWVYNRWRENPGMHIFHYAAYEISAIRRLSTRHDTRQEEVDDLLRNIVFVDLYQTVRHGLLIGEENYSIKSVEHLYRPRRTTDVASAVDSIVQYSHWMESDQSSNWRESDILRDIRDYNEDDCRSTLELLQWLRKVGIENNIQTLNSGSGNGVSSSSHSSSTTKVLSPDVIARLEVIEKLRKKTDLHSGILADLVDFHRREEKPMWWRMFDRAKATAEVMRDDAGCIEGILSVGSPRSEKQSQIQAYKFDPSQECKLASGDRSTVMFSHNLEGTFTLVALNLLDGTLELKISTKKLGEVFGGSFPKRGSLIPNEFVSASTIQKALTEIAEKHLSNDLHVPVIALFDRDAPSTLIQEVAELTTNAAIRVANSMSGGCFVIQGPPGTGKTYTAAHVINNLVASGKKVGVASNSHKAVVNLLLACGEALKKEDGVLRGIKVGGDDEGALYIDNPSFQHVKENKDALGSYSGGVVGGTAWLFALKDWEGVLDYLFIDEAGQVSLANAVAIARSAKNIVLLGDQMQLEQPIQGTHPGDAGLSSLQYALKDIKTSKVDSPVFHAVIPPNYGLFLGESRRMHPMVCRFISESIYEGRLNSHSDCSKQIIKNRKDGSSLITKESGVVFIAVEHDGNVQQSDEEIAKVIEIYNNLLGSPYTESDGQTKALTLEDFLFIAPYNAQVRALQGQLPEGARVGSVDKFQGQEAPVCILSLCSSYGEYGSRGLAFILDRNRINVAISRAKCLAVVVADSRIANTEASTLNEMKLINMFCKLVNS